MKYQATTARLTLLFALTLLLAIGPGQAGQIRAFSLREADRMLQQGATSRDLGELAGITRFAGMVFDREGGDVILVGTVRDDLPAITVDDLAVALRCRLLSGKYPSVSIDMTDKTEETGMQEVRFIGDVAQTQFGYDFLQCDVILKKYSLDLLASVEGVVPYLKHYEADMARAVEMTGRQVASMEWYSEEQSKAKAEEYKGREAAPGKSTQSRFWFHVMGDESYLVEQDDVYVIEELRLGVKAEMVNVGTDESQDLDIPAEAFSGQFTGHYHEVCDANPLLKRLKAMFDLVCIAEGVANLGEARPALEFLLGKYQVAPKATPEQYSLVHRVGELTCDNGDVMLSQLSGGISLEAVLMALEDGDVSGLKIAVLQTRPAKNSLSWELPLDQWKMPNNNPPAKAISQASPSNKLEVEFPGFALSTQRLFFPKDGTGMELAPFNGFKGPMATPPLKDEPPILQQRRRLTISADNHKLQGALLANDWETVVKLLENVTVRTPDPVLRFIKAHACLATNRNNESVNLFATVTLGDLDKWAEWCEASVTGTGDPAIMLYFLGDIHARLENYKEAIVHFSEAFDQDRSCFLALNARGTAYIVIGDYEKALSDLLALKMQRPDFVDIYNSLAMMNIRQKKGLILNSKKGFKSVLDISSDFALAYHGLGCLELMDSKEMVVPADNQNLARSLELAPDVMALLIANEERYRIASLDKHTEAMYVSAGSEGTSLQKQYRLIGSLEATEIAQIRHDTAKLWEMPLTKQRLDSARQDVVAQANTMNLQELRGLSPGAQREVSRVTGDVLTEFGKIHDTAGRRSEQLNAQSEALKYGNKLISGTTPPTAGLKVIVHLGEQVSRWNSNEYIKHKDAALRVINTVAAIDVKARIASDEIRQHGVPDQTQKGHVQRAIERAGDGHSSSPPGYSESIGASKYYPGAQHGGATTDRALLTWNDGEWPFEPIFGLLYQVPQASNPSNKPVTEGEDK